MNRYKELWSLLLALPIPVIHIGIGGRIGQAWFARGTDREIKELTEITEGGYEPAAEIAREILKERGEL